MAALLLALWRIWKWLVRLVTGKCEIVRLCESKASLEQRTWRIEQSLRNSRSTALQRLVVGGGVPVDEAERTIAREKKIGRQQLQALSGRLRPSLERILGVRALWADIEALRAESYSQDNEEHERALMELWSRLMPGSPLEARITKQWQEIGFQGSNPATDFRGMGTLSLHCMLHFAAVHEDKARSVLSHSHHPQYSYPFAVVGINLTSLLYTWLETGALNNYLYTTATDWPLPLEEFMEIFCYLFDQLDKFWLEWEPENVMDFPRVKAEFKKAVEDKELRGKITRIMRLQSK